MVELRYEAPVAFTASRFAAPAAAEPQADSLNNILARFDIASMRSQFQLPCIGDPLARRGGGDAAARARSRAVCQARDGHRVHPEQLRAGRAEEERGRQEDRDGVQPAEVGVESLRGAASGAGDAGRIGRRQPQLRTGAGLSQRCAGRHRRRRRSGAWPAPRARASPSATSKATGTAPTKICRRGFRCSAAP